MMPVSFGRDRSRARVALLMALLLVLSGIAPSVSRVLAAGVSADLCVTDRSRPSGPPGAAHDAACALCVPHGGSDSAPPPVPSGRVTAGAAQRALPAPGVAFVSRAPYAVHARGPPAS